ncbi:HD domain-containing protein [Metallumcola ferriviriculae]|uniref:HD domain-containing protein n=1 Tax=Metallumcola ferriviriculae TaxID=3039180 RepID=A0AAU0UM76_9FIRM|nr:HD domain-containing protein [Desulfitibacteraceae bacterium MK1]
MKQYINELQPGVKVNSVFALAKKQLIPFRDPSKGKFLSLVIADKTGQIEAKLWDGAEEIAAGLAEEDLIQVEGAVSEYRGSNQITIEKVSPAAAGKWQPEDFLPAGKDKQLLLDELRQLVASLNNEHLKTLLANWFSDKDFLQQYLTCPAAKKVHHACIGGLAEHSLEVCSYAVQVAKNYSKINRDVVLVGALLHDIGKIMEYRYQTSIAVTDSGKLFGHPVLGWDMIAERIGMQPDFPAPLADHLKHIILTHHGQLEWGAPVLPQTPEAMTVFYCDLLSGRIRQVFDIIQQDEDDELWTRYDRLISRAIYRGYKED